MPFLYVKVLDLLIANCVTALVWNGIFFYILSYQTNFDFPTKYERKKVSNREFSQNVFLVFFVCVYTALERANFLSFLLRLASQMLSNQDKTGVKWRRRGGGLLNIWHCHVFAKNAPTPISSPTVLRQSEGWHFSTPLPPPCLVGILCARPGLDSHPRQKARPAGGARAG